MRCTRCSRRRQRPFTSGFWGRSGPGTWPSRIARPEVVRALVEATPARLFITAHTHQQFVRQVGPVTIVNPGTVAGENSFRDGRILAEYLLCDWDAGSRQWRFTFHQIPFDVAETIRTLERVQGEFPAIERVIAFYRRTSGAQERKIGKLGDKDCKEITPSAGVR